MAVVDRAKPVGPGVLRRHRPGRQSRMPDLDAYVASTPGADPLVGNYVLLHQQDILLSLKVPASAAEEVQASAANYDEVKNGANLRAIIRQPGTDPTAGLAKTGDINLDSPSNSTHIAITTGDFNGDGLDEFACVYLENDGGPLQLVVGSNQDPAKSTQSLAIVSRTTLSPTGSDVARIASGNVTATAAAMFVVGWPSDSGTLMIQVWRTDANLTPVLFASTNGPVVADGVFDLTLGDFDGDGLDEIAIAWQGEGNTLFLGLWDLSASGITAMPSITVGTLGSDNRSIALSSGSCITGSIAQQIVLGWTVSNQANSIGLFALDGSTLAACSPAYQASTDPCRNVRVACGDLNLDGVDELVLATSVGPFTQGSRGQDGGHGALLELTVFTADNQGRLTATSQGRCGFDDAYFADQDFAIAVGAIGPGALPGIVVAVLGWAFGVSGYYVCVIELLPGLQLPDMFNRALFLLPNTACIVASRRPSGLSMALGDFSGKSLRVGPPVPQTFNVVNQVLAVVNTLPLQNNVNFDGGSSLSFTDTKSNNTSIGVTVSKDWTTSDTLSANLDASVIGQLNTSLTRTYGTNFSKSQDSVHSIDQTISINLWKDDLVILSATSYNVWEYPVYDDATGTPKGYLLLVFPDVDGAQTQFLDGTSQRVDYAPDHLAGTLLSYSMGAPLDYTPGSSINESMSFDVSTNQKTFTFDWTNSTTTAKTTSSQVTTSINTSLSASFNFLKFIGIGIQGHFSDTYSKSQVSNYSVTYTDTTSITMSIASLTDQDQEYSVTPYVYFSNQGGFLVVDYSVSDLSGGYWQQNFSTPNATLNLPWAASSDPTLKAMTRSITFEGQSDGTIVVSARIGNYSLVQTVGIQVQFYLGSPSGTPIGQSIKIDTLQPMQRKNVTVTWTPPTKPGTYQVWAVVEPAPPSDPKAFAASQGFANWIVSL